MQNVNQSSAFFLLLTREALERPVVLAELCCAHKAKKGVLVPIRVEWPDAAKNGKLRVPAGAAGHSMVSR